MRVSELFEKADISYNADKKVLMGTVKDWLKAGDMDSSDVQKALTRVKASPIFRNDMAKAGLIYQSSEAQENNGTLNFKVSHPTAYFWGSKEGEPVMATFKASYQIFANGQIRQQAREENTSGQTRLVSPKPRMVVGDKVGSLVKTYTAALQELLTKWEASKKRMDTAVAKAKKRAGDSPIKKIVRRDEE